jgi:hypothetical protein
MRCEEAWEWLSADLDCEARVRPPASTQQHLEHCAECRRFRTAAMGLRKEFAAAKYRSIDPESGDEAILAALRQEGLAGATVATRVGYLARLLRGPSMIAWPFARPALAAMTAALLVTWGSLHWAETCQSSVPPPASHGIAGPAGEMPDTVLLDRWMSGPPTLAALSRLRQGTGTGPLAVSPSRRSAAPARPKSTG